MKNPFYNRLSLAGVAVLVGLTATSLMEHFGITAKVLHAMVWLLTVAGALELMLQEKENDGD